MISKEITGRKPFPNMAGVGKLDPRRVDLVLTEELAIAGIEVERLSEFMRDKNGEPHSVIIGSLHRWRFTRAWYYWIAEGPGIPPDDATRLHEAYGESVRVDGHCGCPSPLEHFHGFAVGRYHVDNQTGLNALAEMIRTVYRRGGTS